MKLLLEKWNKFLNEEEELSEVAGMSPKDFAKMDPLAALTLIRKQKKDPYSVMDQKQLDNYRIKLNKIIDNHRNPGTMQALRRLTDANKTRKEIYGIEDKELEREIGESWEQFERGPGYGGAAVRGRY